MKTTRKSTQKSRVHKDYLIPDALWEEIQPLLPKHVTHHPLGCHRKRVDDKAALTTLSLVTRMFLQGLVIQATAIRGSGSRLPCNRARSDTHRATFHSAAP